jgi:hypothetical protein
MATVVAFHAHPDDEVILTGGTLAWTVADGHRVVVVTATDGRMGNETDASRIDELRSSASILGVHRVECLGSADSGNGRPTSFSHPRGGSDNRSVLLDTRAGNTQRRCRVGISRKCGRDYPHCHSVFRFPLSWRNLGLTQGRCRDLTSSNNAICTQISRNVWDECGIGSRSTTDWPGGVDVRAEGLSHVGCNP